MPPPTNRPQYLQAVALPVGQHHWREIHMRRYPRFEVLGDGWQFLAAQAGWRIGTAWVFVRLDHRLCVGGHQLIQWARRPAFTVRHGQRGLRSGTKAGEAGCRQRCIQRVRITRTKWLRVRRIGTVHDAGSCR